MSRTDQDAAEPDLETQLRSFVGRKGATLKAPDPANRAMIRHWCAALGDTNPAYGDEAFAAASAHAGLIAPPAMLQAWTMPGYGVAPAGPDAVADLYACLDRHGYAAIVATDSEQDYLKPVRIGDVLSSTKTILSISGENSTALGHGFFVTTIVEFVDQDGTAVGRQLHRVLKFKPKPKPDAAPQAPEGHGETTPAPALALRPRPNVTQDTGFFFEGARQGKLLIQRCNACGALQHPPTPACAACGALDLGAIEASGRGRIYSFTIVYAPIVPPFEPPYVVILVELDEGVRIVSELVGTAADDVRIGMDLQVEFVAMDPDLTLPVFRASEPNTKVPLA